METSRVPTLERSSSHDGTGSPLVHHRGAELACVKLGAPSQLAIFKPSLEGRGSSSLTSCLRALCSKHSLQKTPQVNAPHPRLNSSTD